MLRVGWDIIGVGAVPITPPSLHLMGVKGLSHQATTWVVEFSESKLANRLVMFVLANRVSNDDGTCCPSIARVSRESKLSDRQVYQSIEELSSSGELFTLEEKHPKYGTNVYHMPKFWAWYTTLNNVQGVHNMHKSLHNMQKPPEQCADELSVVQPSFKPLPQEQKIVTEKECSQCGVLGVHKCPGPVSFKQRAKRSQVRQPFQRKPFETERPPKYVHSYPKIEPESSELSEDFPRLKPPQ